MARPPKELVVVAANSKREAVLHGMKIKPGASVIPLLSRADLYLLYGKERVPFDIVPGTYVQPWHAQIWHHVKVGRIIPVRTFSIKSLTDEPDEALMQIGRQQSV